MATIASSSTSTLGSGVLSNTLDANHPYYLHPSDNLGMLVTTVVLNEGNYNQWRRSMEIALSSKLKSGFIDGSYLKPAIDSPLMIHWMRCNNMITSWILNSVSTEIRNSIVYIQSAREIWLDLEVRYAQSNVPKLFHLKKELAHLTEGSLSILSYFTKFRTINDELDCLSTKPRCTCGLCSCTVNLKLDTVDQNVQLIQFLMGLSDSFTAIRGQILMMKPLPSLSQSYAMLLQEESQRTSNCSLMNTENVAMAVKSSFQGNKNQIKNNYGRRSSDIAAVVCDYCHMTGHLKDKCYCIHGYPSWHKLFGKPKPKPKLLQSKSAVVANVQQVSSTSDVLDGGTVSVGLHSSVTEGMSLSDTQCQQLIHFLQKSMTVKPTNHSLDTDST
ncbi:uncharacterized protein LOC141714199 [Apium graveolens]|uniref:uncharacterized protein LOC141714199 n=1 Tax=Apium graveolens TaxID=4045 RepID=UPI003D79FDEF